MTQHEFFQHIYPQEQPMQDPPYLQHNLVMLEIANNWPHVRWLMCRYREGWLKSVDQMEELWLRYFVSNKIDPEIYKNEEEFLNSNMKAVPE
jgi:hypothetical protein